MNNKIKILPENIANKIAAGEVVQRPESVVKELIENAIDAKSENIQLIIKKAGKVLIQVCDDGIGMSEEDAIICVQKHATSKISDYEDLEAITTLGFRGEALSSISAVCQVELKTERREDEVGTIIRIDEPGVIIKEKGSFPKGTSISVKNIFYNTPGRRNFLKTDATELKHIIDSFNKVALANPKISFQFYNDNEQIFNYKAGTLEDRIKQIFSDNMLNALLPVSENTEFLKVNGYIGKPSLLKRNKGEQYLFLNNRVVTSKQINHAVFTAFENILEKGDYPFFILFIDIDPHKIDVNVHPTKLEIRFEDEKDVYNYVLAVIRKSIGTHDLVPTMAFGDSINDEKLLFNSFTKTSQNDFSDRPITFGSSSNNNSSTRSSFSDKDIEQIFSALPDDVKRTGNDDSFSPIESYEPKTTVRTYNNSMSEEAPSFIIQLHKKYILSQIKSGLMIIDQHVAHERILYEEALKRYENNMPNSQGLLMPITMDLDPAKFNLVKELFPHLTKIGFDIKFFSKNTIAIEGVPDVIKLGHEELVLSEMLDEYVINQKEKKLEQLDNIAKSFSCKTAIKAGDYLTDNEMRILIDKLFATSMPYVCPHGRPIVIKITLDEFDRRFGRTS